MKKSKKVASNLKEDKALELIKLAGERYGYLNLFKIFIKNVGGSIQDISMNEVIEETIKECDSYDIENIIFNLSITGYETLKCESLAELMQFEQFKEKLEANPYQLKLIA